MLSFLSKFFGSANATNTPEAEQLYQQLFTASRNPALYTDGGVEDSRDGRFEMVLLHLFLLLHVMQAKPELKDLAQAVFNRTFAGFDQNLREMGVGDLGVGKRVKKMAEVYYGRVAEYTPLLDDAEKLQVQLNENIPGNIQVALATYAIESLAPLVNSQLENGKCQFATPAFAA